MLPENPRRTADLSGIPQTNPHPNTERSEVGTGALE